MSKIAELLKLAEQKKEAKPKLEAVPKTNQAFPDKSREKATKAAAPASAEKKISQVGTVGTVASPAGEPLASNKSKAAPERDFQKVANSVVRELKQGVFNGKSKQMYDFLYSLTRGAIQPKRTVRISKPNLMRGTGIGSPQTFYRNLNHLEALGLIKKTEIIGERNGNEYEVFLPEEANNKSVQSVQSVQSDQSAQKLVVLVLPETVLTVPTSEPINIEASAPPKTSFKDNKEIDDEAFAAMREVLAQACRRISGKPPQKNQKAKWKELAELLVMELEVASARTASISDVPAFLTEHLRRRLIAKSEPAKPADAQVFSAESRQTEKLPENSIPEPLSEKGRETTLKTFAEYIEKGQKEFLMCFRETYTGEDWEWLMKQLETGTIKNASDNNKNR